MVAQHGETNKRGRPLSIAQIDRAYLDLCGRAPRLTEQLAPARAMLLSGAYLEESSQVHFPYGVRYDTANDRCSCDHAGPSLCVHQLAMRIRRLAIGLALVDEIAVSRP